MKNFPSPKGGGGVEEGGTQIQISESIHDLLKFFSNFLSPEGGGEEGRITQRKV